MSRRHRRTRLVALLARLRWQRDPRNWTVAGHDHRGHRVQLAVLLTSTGVRIGNITLSRQQAARLRAALRDALDTQSRLTAGSPVARTHPGPAPLPPTPPSDPPTRRSIILPA